MKFKKTLLVVSIGLCIFLIYIYSTNQKIKKDILIKNRDQTTNQALPLVEKETKIYFVGDMMLDRSVRKSVVKNFNGDYNQLFVNLEKLKEADILFGNLEGDVSDVGRNVGSKYSFRMDPIVLSALSNASFDIVSFANNHVGDWSMVAFTDTLKRMSAQNILYTGAGFNKAQAQTPTVIEKNNTKFCFLGFSDVGPNWIKATEKNPGILIASDPEFGTIISNAKKQCDVLIVSIHWGTEYKKIHNARQETLAHSAIDNGADMIIGHHPHVMQDIQTYKDKVIVYSLGNFIFDQYFSKDTMEGMLFEATFKGKNLKSTDHHIVKLNSMYQPKGIFDKENKNCPNPEKKYEDYTYYNVGQNIPIPDTSYVPDDLVSIDSKYAVNDFCLKKEAKDKLEEMIEAAEKENYYIKVSSAYRNYNTQKTLLNNKIKTGAKNASKVIAKPGHSEHQLGVAVDLTSKSISYRGAISMFSQTKEYTWLKNNSYKYGFIESYPENKEDITGYIYESWHYRYVGVEHATNIKDNNQTINQYLEILNKN